MYEKTNPERFRGFALGCGTDKDNPALIRAVEAIRKLDLGESTPEAVDAAVSPLFEEWNKRAGEARSGPVALPAEANSFKVVPLREAAKQANLGQDNPLLVRALKAREKADWRTSWASWLEMEIAVWAFMRTYFEFKSAWPPKADQIEYFLQKIERASLSAEEIQKFRQLAAETFAEWDPDNYSPAFKKRIEAALNRLDQQ